MATGGRSYSDEEVEAIFRRAFERQSAEEGFAHDELVAAANEMGLDEASVERAVRELEAERSEDDVRAVVAARQRERWLRGLVAFLVVAGGLLGMHALGLVGAWVYWLAFGWGALTALRGFAVWRGPSPEAVAKERDTRNRAARRKALALARREEKRRRAEEHQKRRSAPARQRDAGDELERAIEEGVTLLLGAAARKLREAAERKSAPAPQGEFARFVAEKKAQQHGAQPPGAQPHARERPQVRVDAGADEAEPSDDERITEAEEEARDRGRSRGRRRR